MERTSHENLFSITITKYFILAIYEVHKQQKINIKKLNKYFPMAFKDPITSFGNFNLDYQTSKSTKIPLQKKKV